MNFTYLLIAGGLSASCASSPLALDAQHPASSLAEEAPAARRTTLRPDAATLRTRELLAHREQQLAPADTQESNDHAHSH